MDDVDLRELIRLGVQRATLATLTDTDEFENKFWSVVDRLTLLGGLLLEHEQLEIWSELIGAFAEMSHALTNKDAKQADQRCDALFQFSWRLYALGGYAVVLGRFKALPELALMTPEESRDHFWSRYITTAVARGLPEKWKKSLIPPAADWIRTNGEFSVWFGNNQDKIVNALCQYDFWQCAAIIARTKSAANIYPNFGIYWNNRTTPIVENIAREGPAAKPIGVSEAFLAEIIRGLDQIAGKVFFDFNGWDSNSWDNSAIEALLRNNDTPSLRIHL